MSDRIKGLTVILEPNIRDDDAEPIINAISMLKGVARVKPHIADTEHYFAVQSAQHDLLCQIRDLLK